MTVDVCSKQEEILERRSTLLGETIENPDKSITEIIDGLALRLHVSSSILWSDWAKQDEWISDVFSLNRAYANKCVMFHENIKRLGMIAYRTADNSNARVGGLRVAKEANNEILDLCYKIGVFNGDAVATQNVTFMWQTPFGAIDEAEFSMFKKWQAEQKKPEMDVLEEKEGET